MAMYYDKYLTEAFELLKGVRFTYSETATKEVSEVYNNFISSFSGMSGFSYWGAMSYKQQNNAIKAFGLNGKSAPIAIIDDTLFKTFKGGLAFLKEEICTKFLLQNPQSVYVKEFATKEVVMGATNKLGIKSNSVFVHVSMDLYNMYKEFQQKLYTQTPYNVDYVNKLNNDLDDVLKQFEEPEESFSVSNIDTRLRLLESFVDSVEPDNEQLDTLRMAYVFIDVIARLELSNYGKIDTELSTLCSDVVTDDMEGLVKKLKQIRIDYLDYHYQKELGEAKELFADQDYKGALHRVKEAYSYIDTPESKILEIEILLATSDKKNGFNVNIIDSAVKGLSQFGEVIHESLQKSIDDNKSAYDAYIAELKENMAEEVKNNGLTVYLQYDHIKFLKDDSGMNPFMYMALYDKVFNTDVLSDYEKTQLLECHNCLGHNIVDIASLRSMNYYYNLRLNIDMSFKKSERNYKIGNAFAKGLDIFVKASDVLADNYVRNSDRYIDTAIEQGDIDSAFAVAEEVDRINEVKSNPNRLKANNADESKERHEQQLLEEFQLIQDNVLKSVKTACESGTKYDKLLSLYMRIPLVKNKVK